MTYVYLLESAHDRNQRYVGLTPDLKQRFADHNAGRSPHTRSTSLGTSSPTRRLRTSLLPWLLSGISRAAQEERFFNATTSATRPQPPEPPDMTPFPALGI